MKNYVCEKCGSLDLFIKSNGSQTGLYCSDCGKWIKWLSKSEIALAEKFIEEQKKENDNIKQEIKEVNVDEKLEQLCRAVSDHMANNYDKYSPYTNIIITDTHIRVTEDIRGIPVKR